MSNVVVFPGKPGPKQMDMQNSSTCIMFVLVNQLVGDYPNWQRERALTKRERESGLDSTSECHRESKPRTQKEHASTMRK